MKECAVQAVGVANTSNKYGKCDATNCQLRWQMENGFELDLSCENTSVHSSLAGSHD